MSVVSTNTDSIQLKETQFENETSLMISVVNPNMDELKPSEVQEVINSIVNDYFNKPSVKERLTVVDGVCHNSAGEDVRNVCSSMVDEVIDGKGFLSGEFIVHGTYVVSNAGGYEVQLSDCGEMARVRDAFGGPKKVSKWFEIESFESDDEDDEEVYMFIDPQGYKIPLNEVMRVQ